MTIGIYALYWAEQDLVYVGKSGDLKVREYEHFRLMKTGKHTRKLQDAYNNFGKPEFLIVEICSHIELDNKEVFWIAEYDSLNPDVGLNTLPGGQDVGKDTTHASSKFTKQQILNVCELLCDPYLAQKNISKTTGISEAVISTILNGSKHTWIPEELRARIDSTRELRYQYNLPNSKNKNYSIESPDGIVYNIINVSTFAKENKLLGTKLNEVLKGKRPHHLGWKLPTNKDK